MLCLCAAVEASLAPQQTLLQCDSRLADSLARFTAEMTSSKADTGGRGFIVRCLNIMDPLLPTNNLGRSVVRSSLSRIRRALGHGATLVRGMALKVGGCWGSGRLDAVWRLILIRGVVEAAVWACGCITVLVQAMAVNMGVCWGVWRLCGDCSDKRCGLFISACVLTTGCVGASHC